MREADDRSEEEYERRTAGVGAEQAAVIATRGNVRLRYAIYCVKTLGEGQSGRVGNGCPPPWTIPPFRRNEIIVKRSAS